MSHGNHQRIVVGVDLSETGSHAARAAVGLVRQQPGTELHLVNVLPGLQSLPEISEALKTRAQELREYVSRECSPAVGAQPFTIEATFHVRVGQPAREIHQLAVDIDADLIVIGTHGRKGLEKLLLGSVAEELVRTAHLPVLVARPKELDGLPKSVPEPARPGESFRPQALSDRFHLEFVPRGQHISGLL